MLKNQFKRIFKHMRWIYISPHFDDAVLSCGGLIWEQTHSGMPVEIWTVTAGDPPPGPVSDLITRVHSEWQTGSPEETVTLRRSEDKNAARRVGATARHLGIVDALYRRTQTGTLMYTNDVFDPIHPREAGIVEQAAQEISRHLTQYDTLVCPLAIGGHVDHLITRRAVESLGRPLWYYADVPYLLRHPTELAPAVTGMSEKTFFISTQGLTAWQESIAAHASQINSLFTDSQDMRNQIKDYHLLNSGLKIWERETAPA
jgi:LmbE family N-acetylglucosaminyl deacetylase